MINQLMHGRFGLLDYAAKWSTPQFVGYSVRQGSGGARHFGHNGFRAGNEALEEKNVTLNWMVNDLDWMFLIEPQNPGVRGQLTGDRLAAYNAGRAGALEALKNNADCEKFLLEKLGISASRLARAVRGQRAFDGLTSTITAADAGIVPHSDPRAGYQVRDFFVPTGKGIVGALQAGYASREDRGATQRDVYYGYYGFEASSIIHETLHSFTGLDDHALMEKLGGNISVELERHGCR